MKENCKKNYNTALGGNAATVTWDVPGNLEFYPVFNFKEFSPVFFAIFHSYLRSNMSALKVAVSFYVVKLGLLHLV